jgi:hypothetical protein
MPLVFSGTWDQALLAAAVQDAAGGPAPGPVSEGALQQILYFLVRAGVPTRYAVDAHAYGPSCERVSPDAVRLVADEVLTEASPSPERYSLYRPGPAAEELLRAHAAALGPHRATITRVVRCLQPLQPERLELLYALDYNFRWLKAGGGPGPWKERVLARFRQWKLAGGYLAQEVSDAYDSLVRADLIQP